MTEGTLAVVGAEATTIVTGDPGVALVPPDGFWLITSPTVALADGWVVVATLKPALVRSAVARARVSPVTSGICLAGGPLEMNNVTLVPGATGVPARGSVPVACPT